MNSLVSILIPVFNREILVTRAIDSAINQTYKNIEIIIVDNCSTDNTWQIIQNYQIKDKRISIFRNDVNIGPVRNWLECLRRSKGDFIKFIYSDDWIDNNWIEEALKPLIDINIGFSFSPVEIIIPGKDSQVHNIWHLSNQIISSEYYIFRNYFKCNEPRSPGGALFRRSDVVKYLFVTIENPLGIKYDQHGGGIDHLLFLYTAKNYNKIAFVHNIKAYFTGGADSISMNTDLNDASMYAKIYFINEYKTFSILFWLKLFITKIKLRKYINWNITLKDYKFFPFFFKKI